MNLTGPFSSYSLVTSEFSIEPDHYPENGCRDNPKRALKLSL